MRDPVQTFVLSDWQVATLLALGGLPDPAPGTPLRVVRQFPRPLAPGEPGWDALPRGGWWSRTGTPGASTSPSAASWPPASGQTR